MSVFRARNSKSFNEKDKKCQPKAIFVLKTNFCFNFLHFHYRFLAIKTTLMVITDNLSARNTNFNFIHSGFLFLWEKFIYVLLT